jgi:hypothetical protein
MRQGILYIQQILHSEGMTAVKDPDIQQIHWDAYKSLLDRGLLKGIRTAKYTVDGGARGMREVFRSASWPPRLWA